MFRYPVVIGGGTPFLPPVAEDVPLDLIETRTFGSRVIYERYRRVRDDSDDTSNGALTRSAGMCRKRIRCGRAADEPYRSNDPLAFSGPVRLL
jgi:hypothetical protein